MGGSGPLAAMVTGQLAFTVLIAAPLALVVSLLLLRSYLAAVKHGMRSRSSASVATAGAAAVPAAAGPVPRVERPLAVEFIDGAGENSAGLARASRASLGRWRVVGVYTIAGLAFSATMAAGYFAANGIGFLPFRFAFVMLCFAWPVVLAVGLVGAISWRGWLVAVLAYLGVLMATVAPAMSAQFTPVSVVLAWTIFNLAATLIVLFFLYRPIRAVGPLVMAFMLAAVSGSHVAVSVLGGDDARIRWAAGLGRQFGLGGEVTFVAVLLAGALVLAVAGWLLLKGLGWLYRAGRVSDQSIMIDSIFLIFAIVDGVDLSVAGPAWLLVAAAAFVVYKIVAVAGFALTRPGETGPAPRLLLLRVFSLGRRSEHLFDGLAKLWRHAGSIRMIAGPDLATTTVEPHEFLDFVGGRLQRRFIAGPETLSQRLSETGSNRDLDGRYRVSDFFCHDDTWKMVLERLAGESEVVLMDLRGLTPANRGCVFEIHELLARVPLRRVVFVVDGTTDEAFMRQTFNEGWARAPAGSPNRAEDQPRVALFRFEGNAALPSLIGAVAAAST